LHFLTAPDDASSSERAVVHMTARGCSTTRLPTGSPIATPSPARMTSGWETAAAACHRRANEAAVFAEPSGAGHDVRSHCHRKPLRADLCPLKNT